MEPPSVIHTKTFYTMQETRAVWKKNPQKRVKAHVRAHTSKLPSKEGIRVGALKWRTLLALGPIAKTASTSTSASYLHLHLLLYLCLCFDVDLYLYLYLYRDLHLSLHLRLYLHLCSLHSGCPIGSKNTGCESLDAHENDWDPYPQLRSIKSPQHWPLRWTPSQESLHTHLHTIYKMRLLEQIPPESNMGP